MKRLTVVKQAEEIEFAESEIQKKLEENLEKIEEGVEYVDSFVNTPVGEIDTLAIDEDKMPVIIEYKRPDGSVRDALIQSLDYYVWCDENIEWLERYVRKIKPELLKEGEHLGNDIRIIIVANEFEDRIKRSVLGIEPDTLLVEYRLFEHAPEEIGLLFDKVVDTSSGRPGRAILPKTEDEHFAGKEDIRPVYDELKKKILAIDSNIKPTSTQYYISFAHRIGFCGVTARRRHLIIHLKGKIESERFSPWAHNMAWGKAGDGGDVIVKNADEIDEELMGWIKQAYDLAA